MACLPRALPPERCWRRWRVFYRSGGPAVSCAIGVAVPREREGVGRRVAGLAGWPSRVLCRVTGPTGLRRARWPKLLLPIRTAAAPMAVCGRVGSLQCEWPVLAAPSGGVGNTQHHSTLSCHLQPYAA